MLTTFIPFASVRIAIRTPSQWSSSLARTPVTAAPAISTVARTRLPDPSRSNGWSPVERPGARLPRRVSEYGLIRGGAVSVGSGPSPRSYRIAARTPSLGPSSHGILCGSPGLASCA